MHSKAFGYLFTVQPTVTSLFEKSIIDLYCKRTILTRKNGPGESMPVLAFIESLQCITINERFLNNISFAISQMKFLFHVYQS